MMRRAATQRPRAEWVKCPGCETFDCLPTGTWSHSAMEGLEEKDVCEWMGKHNLRRDRPTQTVYCNNTVHGSNWVTKILTKVTPSAKTIQDAAEGNTEAQEDIDNPRQVWTCPTRTCRRVLPYDGPLVKATNESGFLDIMGVICCWADRSNVTTCCETTKLSRNTVQKKYAMVEAILASWMRYHCLGLENYHKDKTYETLTPLYAAQEGHRLHPAFAQELEDPTDLQTEAFDQDESDEPPLAERERIDHVEADESHFGHRMYESGARVAQGKIIDFAIRPIADKSIVTLQSFIRQILPAGTVLATDS
eukprot:GDKJ01037755.1.p1 GENE.GDKJ01037755.1~~GDKJ01037755.1.p1  ORF type:complete len:307 (-),score=-21.50 GDKJ01037755.1:496-1416(-)